MKFRFDEPDAIVIDDIPDDMMLELERQAALAGSSVEEYVRHVLLAPLAEEEQKSGLSWRQRGI